MTAIELHTLLSLFLSLSHSLTITEATTILAILQRSTQLSIITICPSCIYTYTTFWLFTYIAHRGTFRLFTIIASRIGHEIDSRFWFRSFLPIRRDLLSNKPFSASPNDTTIRLLVVLFATKMPKSLQSLHSMA